MVRRVLGWTVMCFVISAGVAHAEKKPVRLAIMDFTAGTPNPEVSALGIGLQSMITTDLSNVGAITIVERARLKDIQGELALQQTAAIDKDTAVKLGGLSGATHLLVGAITVNGGTMRLDARMIDATTGVALVTAKQEGAEATFFELEAVIVKKVVDGLTIRLGKTEKAALAKPQTQNLEAFQKYSEGLAAFDEKRTDAAVAAMQAAVAADPSFALASQKLKEFQLALPNMKPPEVKKPDAQCQQNPLQTPSCQPPAGQPTPPDFRAPTTFVSGGKKPYSLLVHAGGDTAACITPCELHLPKGQVDIEVMSPTHFHKTLDAPGGPASVEVRHLNKTNIIIGAVLGGVTIALVATSIGFHQSSDSNLLTYWDVPLVLASGMVFPSVYYLMNMGKNDARLVTP